MLMPTRHCGAYRSSTMEYSKLQIKEALQKTPGPVLDMIASIHKVDTLTGIIQKFNMPAEKLRDLGKEVDYALMGLSKQSDFVANVKERLNISFTDAQQIGDKINNEIFRPVQSELAKTNKIPTPQPPPNMQRPLQAGELYKPVPPKPSAAPSALSNNMSNERIRDWLK